MRRIGWTLVLLVLAAATPVANASHPTAMCLDIDPEVQHDVTNDDMLHLLRAYPGATDADHPPQYEGCVTGAVDAEQDWSGTNIDFEVSGVSDLDSSDSPATPDMTCTIPSGGSYCSVSPRAGESGVQTIRAWIDLDGDDETVEADIAEGRDEDTAPGDSAEPDATDVSQWDWSTMDTTSESTITLAYGERRDAFRGRVSSEYDLCSDERTVKVFKRLSDGRRLIGPDTTDREGTWEVPAPNRVRGRFYAVAPATTRHTASPSTDVTCFKARSDPVRIR